MGMVYMTEALAPLRNRDQRDELLDNNDFVPN